MSVEIDGTVMLSEREALDVTEVSRQTLWRWRRSGKVPPGCRYRDRFLLFTPEEVDEMRSFANGVAPARLH